MRPILLGIAGAAALAVTLIAISSLSSQPAEISQPPASSTALAVSPASLQTTQELKATWRPLRNEPLDFYPDRIWMYAGPETYLWGRGKLIGDLKAVLRKGHYETQVMTFDSLRTAPLRAVCWDQHTHVIIFPPFAEYPDIHPIAKTDLKGYVSTGNNLVFLGGFATIGLLNEVFGFRLQAEVYQEGPFYRSPRYAPGTIFEGLPSRLGEAGKIYGVKLSSMPPGARSYYDTLGDSVVWSIRYDFGMITYIGSEELEPFHMGPWHKVLRAAVSI
mmetsp:Transcript_8220/g.13024  ORF Transcript_8220/g.13024 Transcript_8220/m.13024 type:complete len:274 (+) Transcript_8220:2-823(+)